MTDERKIDLLRMAYDYAWDRNHFKEARRIMYMIRAVASDNEEDFLQDTEIGYIKYMKEVNVK